MTCATCPNCGYELSHLAVFTIGHLSIEEGWLIRWRGRPLPFTASQRLLVAAIARAEGVPVKRIALAEAMGSDERQDPENVVAVQLNRVMTKFRDVDPAFDQIQSVRGSGLRWKVEEDA
jgi:DNA-binding response OmpR family regulator